MIPGSIKATPVGITGVSLYNRNLVDCLTELALLDWLEQKMDLMGLPESAILMLNLSPQFEGNILVQLKVLGD
jgi:hypothetical protein